MKFFHFFAKVPPNFEGKALNMVQTERYVGVTFKCEFRKLD